MVWVIYKSISSAIATAYLNNSWNLPLLFLASWTDEHVSLMINLIIHTIVMVSIFAFIAKKHISWVLRSSTNFTLLHIVKLFFYIYFTFSTGMFYGRHLLSSNSDELDLSYDPFLFLFDLFFLTFLWTPFDYILNPDKGS